MVLGALLVHWYWCRCYNILNHTQSYEGLHLQPGRKMTQKWLQHELIYWNTLYIKGHSSALTEVVAFKDAALLPTCSKL